MLKDILSCKKRIDVGKHIFSGRDDPKFCLNKEHFYNYKKKIIYHYNSKGFRDREWPNDVSDVIWCVGDSFTVGIGQPFVETWPQLLEKKTGKRCINVGVESCSNDTMCLRIKEIYRLYKPKLIVVMWSYLSRRRLNGEDVQLDKNDFGDVNDYNNFKKNFNITLKIPTNVIHTIVPNAYMGASIDISKNFKNIINFKQLDYARDYHHFDVKTSEHLVNLLTKKINDFDK